MIDKDEHKREQNEQFERACNEVQKYHRREYMKEFMKLVGDVIIILIGIAGVLFIIEDVIKS